jgi:hypothetical protein
MNPHTGEILKLSDIPRDRRDDFVPLTADEHAKLSPLSPEQRVLEARLTKLQAAITPAKHAEHFPRAPEKRVAAIQRQKLEALTSDKDALRRSRQLRRAAAHALNNNA